MKFLFIFIHISIVEFKFMVPIIVLFNKLNYQLVYFCVSGDLEYTTRLGSIFQEPFSQDWLKEINDAPPPIG